MTTEVGVGIVGCGAISEIYFTNLARFPGVRVVHAADLLEARARGAAENHGIPVASGLDGLLADAEVDLVLNLTVPVAHAEVSLKAIAAGKSVYSEKPLATTRAEAMQILDAAGRAGVRAGAAPDTFYGPGLQAARRLIDDGGIGDVIGGAAFMLCHGHESWHPAPDFYYRRGGGPLFDMGPYYLTALVNLVGPVARVQATTATTFPRRTIGGGPRDGELIDVEVPTHVTAILEFAGGGAVTLVQSFDVWAGQAIPIQLWGTEGSLSVPDPNGFGGEVKASGRGADTWRVISPGRAIDWRGIGVADMARALRQGGTSRADAELSFHVLDVMEAVTRAGASGQPVTIESTCGRPAPVSDEEAAALMGAHDPLEGELKR